MKSKDFGLALLYVVCAATARPQRKEEPCQAANRLLAQGQFEAARDKYQTCVKEGTPKFENLSNLGMVDAQLGQFREAISAYRQALALSPDNPQLHMNLGLAFLKTSRFDEAAREFSRTLVVDPENENALELLAFCHYQLKDYELTALEVARVHNLKPGEASAAFLLGSAYLKLRMYDKAIPLIDQALRTTGSAETHAILGEAYLGVKAYKRAQAEFTKALDLTPRMPGLHAGLGTAYSGLGNTDQAIAEYEKELATEPSSFEANYYLGRLKRLSGDLEAAKKYLEKAEQVRPEDPSIVFEKAVFAFQSKDYPKAEALLQQVLGTYPNYSEAHVLLSQVYFRTNRPEQGQREKAMVNALGKEAQARQSSAGKDGQGYGGNSPDDVVQR